MNEKLSVVDLLLRSELPDIRKQLPEKRVEVRRLSEQAGQPVVFRLQGLPYGEVQKIRSMSDAEAPLQILLGGCRDPDFGDRRLLRPEAGIVTPSDALKAMLTPGEIMDLSQEIEKLSGFRQKTISDVKN